MHFFFKMALLCSLEWSQTQDPPAPVLLVLGCRRAPSLKRCTFGDVNLMHPYFQKSGSNDNFWTRGRETPRRWARSCAFIIAFSNLRAHPSSLTTKHFSALNKLCNKRCQVCQGTQGDKTHVSTSANLRAVIRKGLQRCSSNQSVELCRPEPRRTVPSPGHFHGHPNALWVSGLHSRVSVLHLCSSLSSTWHRPVLREDLSLHLLDL